jgi:hypothetical protein
MGVCECVERLTAGSTVACRVAANQIPFILAPCSFENAARPREGGWLSSFGKLTRLPPGPGVHDNRSCVIESRARSPQDGNAFTMSTTRVNDIGAGARWYHHAGTRDG